MFMFRKHYFYLDTNRENEKEMYLDKIIKDKQFIDRRI